MGRDEGDHGGIEEVDVISRQRKWQLRMAREDRCQQCGEIITEKNLINCIPCMERRLELIRKRKGYKKQYRGKLWRLKNGRKKA